MKHIEWHRISIVLGGLLLAAAHGSLTGCQSANESSVHAQSSKDLTASLTENKSVPPMQGFSWVVPGQLAAMPLPGGERPLADDAAFLQSEGIGVLVSLTEEPPEPTVLASDGIEQRHIPVQDYAAPTLDQMIEFVAVVEQSVAAGTPVGVHCTAGLGRSGTMSAAYLVAEGATAAEAITSVRRLREGSIETSAQEDAVRRFEQHLAATR